MNKLVEILEQHCQWIAIGIGGLFLAWILWAYVLVHPAKAVVGTEELTPGTVDDYVRGSAERLEALINEPSSETPPAKMKDPSEPWKVSMAGTDRKLPQLGSYAFSSIPWREEIKQENDVVAERQLVKNFPKLPPAETLSDEASLKAARATVIPFPPMVAGAPGMPPPAPQPVQPGVLPVNATDISYVRGDFRISTQEIAKAFGDENIPPNATTSIAAIKVLRQEVLPNNTFGPTEVVAIIPNSVQLMTPPNNGNFQDMQTFKVWTEQPTSQTALLQPPFLSYVSGEGPWDAPQKLEILDPEVERQRKLDENKAKAEAAKAARPPVQPRPRPRRGSEEGNLNHDPSRPASLNELAGVQLAQVRPGGMFPGVPAGEPDPVEPAQPTQPGQPGVNGLPPAAFVPNGAPNIIGWYFDTNVKEGHSYRYQVVYGLINPIFNSNLADPNKPELVQTLVLWSTESADAWSAPIFIESSTRFFLSNPNWPSNTPSTVTVEIFKWAAGKWQSRNAKIGAGDRVIWSDGKTVFDTDHLLVDIRFDERLERAYALFLKPDGTLLEREPIADRTDSLRTALQRAVQGAVTPAAGTEDPGMETPPPPPPGRPGRRAAVPPEGT